MKPVYKSKKEANQRYTEESKNCNMVKSCIVRHIEVGDLIDKTGEIRE